MRLTYQVTFILDIDEENMLGETPSEFLAASIEEDPATLFENSTFDKFKLLKASKSVEEKNIDTDEDEDDLTVLDEDELNFEE